MLLHEGFRVAALRIDGFSGLPGEVQGMPDELTGQTSPAERRRDKRMSQNHRLAAIHIFHIRGVTADLNLKSFPIGMMLHGIFHGVQLRRPTNRISSPGTQDEVPGEEQAGKRWPTDRKTGRWDAGASEENGQVHFAFCAFGRQNISRKKRGAAELHPPESVFIRAHPWLKIFAW